MAENVGEPLGEIEIEVAYAKPDEQAVVKLAVPQGTTLLEAISLSGLLRRFPEISSGELMTGVFGNLKDAGYILNAGDRAEIYRPLINDPKEARRQRALHRK